MKKPILSSLLVLTAIATCYGQDPDPCPECPTNTPPVIEARPVFLNELALRLAKVEVWNATDQSDISTVMTSSLWQPGPTNTMVYVQTWTTAPSLASTNLHMRWTLATTNATNPNLNYYTSWSAGLGFTTIGMEPLWSGTNGEHFATFSTINPGRKNFFFQVETQ